MTMQPDRDQIELFVDGLFRHASPQGFVSLRAFYEEDSAKAFRINPTALSGGLKFLIDVAEDDANRAANHPKPVVFCPPIAVFANKDSARERDIAEGLALSVECDQHPHVARAKLEAILGPATMIVRSGGKWTDPATGQAHDKLHLHWRLRAPARGEALPTLKQARDLAARLVGGDPSNKPVCHPIRWPGSWHRKAEPVLCEIETANPDDEIDLAAALAALTAACPERPREKANGKDHSSGTADWSAQVQNIISGDGYHGALTALAAKMLVAGMSDGAAVKMLRALMESSTAPRDGRWENRYDDIPRAVSTAREKYGDNGSGISQGPEGLRENSGPDAPKPFVFNPEPYSFPNPAMIPKRGWLYGRHYLRGVVSATLGAPGRLKSTTSLTEIIGMWAGIDLLTGTPLECGPLRGAYLNGEENQDELDRRAAAICQRYHLRPPDHGNHLWVISTRDKPLRFAIPGQRGAGVVNKHVVDAVLAWCEARGIDVLVVDPLISFHSVRESDSGDMDLLCKEAFGAIAGNNRSVDLVAHPRKPAPGEINTTMDDLRGSSAQHGAIRTGRTFNFMTTAEATQLGIEEDKRRLHVRIESGKGGPGPVGKANWVRIEVETLPNGDDVAVAVAWKPPDHFADVTVAHMEAVRNWGITGEFRVDSRSPKWLGWKVAELLGLKARHGGDSTKADLAKINKLLKTWRQSNILDIAKRPDEKSKDREFYISGSAAPQPPDPTDPTVLQSIN
jgi:hypothetical protein